MCWKAMDPHNSKRRSDSADWILSQSPEVVMGHKEVSGEQRQALIELGPRKEKP